MASTTKESITVKALSKFGFQLESGEYVGWSKNISPKQQGMVVPGGVFDMEIYKAESGKRYCNAVFEGRAVASKPAPLPAAVAKPVATKVSLPKTETMSKAEWSAKDRSQLIGGLSHDAATLTAAVMAAMSDMSVSAILPIYKDFLEGMLAIREELK